MNFKNITIEYNYLDLPAPFCYTKKLKITPTATGLHTEYALEYIDREDFSQEELEDEGFSGDDNESWKGDLHTNWLETLDHLTTIKRGEKASSANECIVHIDGEVFDTYGNESRWDYFIQEITQAIYETATWEEALTIRYCKKESDKAPIQKLQIFFRTRTATLNQTDKTAKSVEWNHIQQLLKLYYLQEFKEGEHSNKIPNQAGIYSDPSDGFWYGIKNSSANLNKGQQEKLIQVLEEIFG
ncbi:hypothetical protein [Cytophaga hutchinsonii]|uniref:Uncharacterized protein n=1 Tax=Cytophaga hutchinsonii (strain ATCC 33406 / DSM 1761 / CIP 103989 / NBRC 15051 / NCIMB 9469 / D465) TaxID=269798 RepID=A0A6N4SRW1_CYTH3|nr:hypothetical protein [Cytophaga hutchinsonii]ABG59146.1 hypothetical protein CHU_1880 [Cytophaga hutchinsonii ATCC 33406]SFX35650.1 hypothetical protein SAMN04487930_103161 [Cytophaga hutchinsonii ATCC 33406]